MSKELRRSNLVTHLSNNNKNETDTAKFYFSRLYKVQILLK